MAGVLSGVLLWPFCMELQCTVIILSVVNHFARHLFIFQVRTDSGYDAGETGVPLCCPALNDSTAISFVFAVKVQIQPDQDSHRHRCRQQVGNGCLIDF